ncbi:tetratricopeptide repeat protein [Psychromarinibacter sp. C21-152]|uniref:Tetratricopeptide repeat protein n=1 Tax=Psychromarinibacter sediminicola TaxID=3033385 RepID=A0AAE3NZV4_9RHOB|nr:tetratricopeptide repeat protein [Psychromarinibacter sediminicola]MDF0603767.1 tetratricopeptide repeat protein [Psychromarinibacter sediminicola]
MLRPFLLCLALGLAAAPASAQPSQDEIAEARQLYIDGAYAAALKVLIPAAEAGDANAQNILADAYDEGNGVPQDRDTALDWWEKSAAQDFPRALYNLGLFHQESDPDRAAGYYERAAAQGNDGAMVNLGHLLERGRVGGARDVERARDLYAQAVEAGNLLAMNNLGRLYVGDGDGIDNDFAYALDLFWTAAEAGDPMGLNNLGAMYANAYGVTYDPLAAIALYRMAAQAGHARAAVNLAWWLIDWESGWSDPAEGWAWCLIGMERAPAEDAEEIEAECAELSGLIDAETRAAGAALTPSLIR